MDISLISNCFKYTQIVVSPDQLLLDPNNPRIVEDVDGDKNFSISELATESVQKYILSVINKDVYHIRELIDAMQEAGFVPGSNDMIVKAVPSTNKYLVLEGNRRTTALKHLLNQKNALPQNILRTFEKIKVKEFVFNPIGGLAEDLVVDFILGKIHIDGPLPWGALEKAHYIYHCYLREMRQRFGPMDRFEFDSDCAAEVGKIFNFEKGDVRRQIQVYRVYQQLKQNAYDVKPDHFTLIDLAVGNRQMRDEYFGFDDETFQFTKSGLERLNKLCINEEKPINNPKEFRAFAKIFENGTEYEVKCVENNEQSIDDVLRRVKTRINDKAFFNELDDIKHSLKGLLVTEFRGTQAEVDLIERIKFLVDEKLWPLAKKKLKE